VASCTNCGSNLARKARYCPECGQPTSAGDTRVLDVPPAETGRVPVEYVNSEPRYYGVTPTTLVLVLAGVAFTLAVVLFALGRWPFGLIAVGAGVLLVLIFLEAARRRPDGVVARSTTDALDGFRARAGLAADSLARRGRAARRVLALQRELQRMSALRGRLLFELGERSLKPRTGSSGTGWRSSRRRWSKCPTSPDRAIRAVPLSSRSPIRPRTKAHRRSRRSSPNRGRWRPIKRLRKAA
jgi:hypothetical protein